MKVVGRLRSVALKVLPSSVARALAQRLKDYPALWAYISKAPVENRRRKDPSRLRAKTIGIFDDFSFQCLKHELDITKASRKKWREQLDATQFDLLLVESAWHGNDGSWSYTLSKFDRHGKDLIELVAACKAKGIPTVFWNKEDPSNFEVFKAAAKIFDFVFTTDSGCIEKYREVCGHDRIFDMPFAAQPTIHNPIRGANPVLPRVCFAGSWRGAKYPERVRAFESVLDAPLEMGVLDIYDRYAGHKDKSLWFPEKYQPAVKGSLSYLELVPKYREYAAFLNVNSVEDSPTMFSRRVFEILASGTPVISTHSVGIQQMLGNTVLFTDSPSQTRDLVSRLLVGGLEGDKARHLGYRDVHSRHTYGHRVDQMLMRAGVAKAPRAMPLVSIICVSNRPEFLERAISNIRRQVYPNFEVIFVSNSEKYDLDLSAAKLSVLGRVKVLSRPSEQTLAECLNFALEHASGEFFAKMDDDDFYGAHYLSDSMLAFEYSGAHVVGKRTYYCYLEGPNLTAIRFAGGEFKRTSRIQGATIIAHRKSTEAIKFTAVRQGTDSIFLRDCLQRDLSIFSADRFNFVHVRRATNATHTWQISEQEFLANCTEVVEGNRQEQVMF